MPKLLFVDDEQFILLGMKRLLKNLASEYDIDFASSGKEALEKITQKHFDIVITDMYMPEIDGVQLLETVRQIRPETVRIIMTGLMESSLENLKKDIAHIILSKPVKSEMLIDTIRNCIDNKEQLIQQ